MAKGINVTAFLAMVVGASVTTYILSAEAACTAKPASILALDRLRHHFKDVEVRGVLKLKRIMVYEGDQCKVGYCKL